MCLVRGDMNVRQVATSEGDFYRIPRVKLLEARKKRYQRQMARRVKGSNRRAVSRHRAAKTQRKIAKVRHNWQHHVSRSLADRAGTIVIEKLKPKAMTASAKGTVENPGKNVRQKAGLNRGILATGWGAIHQMLDYKAAQVITVPAAYTSQRCAECGCVRAENRRTRANFRCVLCGHCANADTNAAINILASGSRASGRREAFPLGTSPTRQMAEKNPARAGISI